MPNRLPAAYGPEWIFALELLSISITIEPVIIFGLFSPSLTVAPPGS